MPTWFEQNAVATGGSTGTAQASNAPYTGTFTGGGQYPLASVMGTGLMQPWTTPFQAPNDVTQQNDPGFRFRLNEGLQAIQRSAAAKGTLLTGGTMKDLIQWSQNTASNEYEKVYNRAKGEYDTAYNIFGNNQNSQYSRLAGMSNAGQNAATNYGQTSAGLTTGAANATAAGQAASGAAWGNAISGSANALGSAYMYGAMAPTATRVPKFNARKTNFDLPTTVFGG